MYKFDPQTGQLIAEPGALTEATGGRSYIPEMLLAAGSGMLQGKNLAQGVGLAGQGLLGVAQAQRADQMRREALQQQAQQQAIINANDRARLKLAQDQAQRARWTNMGMGFMMNQDTGEVRNPPPDALSAYMAAHAQARGPQPWQRVGNVRSPEGEPLGQGYFNSAHPGIYIEDENGQLKRAPSGTMEISEAAGAPLTQSMYNKLQDAVFSDEVGLEKIAKYAQSVGGLNQGMDLLADQISGKFKTLFNTGKLTPQELNTQLANGQLQGLLGGLRTEILGPGVMTEYDAQRLVSYIGGDVSALTNKEVVAEALKRVWDYKVRGYKLHVSQLNRSSPFYSGETMQPNIPNLEPTAPQPAPMTSATPVPVSPEVAEIVKRYLPQSRSSEGKPPGKVELTDDLKEIFRQMDEEDAKAAAPSPMYQGRTSEPVPVPRSAFPAVLPMAPTPMAVRPPLKGEEKTLWEMIWGKRRPPSGDVWNAPAG